MIKFSNGYKFKFCCASGALGYDGDGYWFEQPWRWFGFIQPKKLTIITKTLTYNPRKGNYIWYKPWTCFKPIKDGYVNAFGLTNPGYSWWLGVNNSDSPYRKIMKNSYNVIVSLLANSIEEARIMAIAFNMANIVGIEINVSCPNISHDASIKHVCEITEEFAKHSKHPLVLKLSYDQPYVAICKELHKTVEAFDLINSVPWDMVFPNQQSPLHPLKGGVSGKLIKTYARTALMQVKDAVNTQIISGGGIDSEKELILRSIMGADACSFGTIFIKTPWLPNKIIERQK